jgi:hypothetical protein
MATARAATCRRHTQITGVDKAKVILGHIVEFAQSKVFYVGLSSGRRQNMSLALFVRASIPAI